MTGWAVTQKILDGTKNCAVKITGFPPDPDSKWVRVVDFKDFSPAPSKVKIEHIEWAVTGRIELLLAWWAEGRERELLFPLSSRGYMNFSDYNGGLTSLHPELVGGIELCTQDSDSMKKGLQCFTVFIDLIKQGA